MTGVQTCALPIFTELQSQLRGVADSASFSGENWLSVDSSAVTYNATKTIVSSFSRTAGAVSIGTISIDVGGTKLFDANDQSGILDTASTTTNGGVSYSVAGSTDALDISALTDSNNDLADLEEIIGTVDGTISSMTDSATALGAAKARIGIQTGPDTRWHIPKRCGGSLLCQFSMG